MYCELVVYEDWLGQFLCQFNGNVTLFCGAGSVYFAGKRVVDSLLEQTIAHHHQQDPDSQEDHGFWSGYTNRIH